MSTIVARVGLGLLAALFSAQAIASTPAADSTVAFFPPSTAPRRVLVLYPDDRFSPANILFDESLRAVLGSDPRRPIDCSSEFLDEVRFPVGVRERMRELLRAKYGAQPPDVIVAFAPASLEFCLQERAALFPAVPIVFAALGTARPAGLEQLPNVTGVRSSLDGPATLRLALRLHPRTRQVFLVESFESTDSTLSVPGPSAIRASEFPVIIHSLASRPLPPLLDSLATLPENSLVLDLSMFPSRRAAEAMARAARAPMYAAYDPVAGTGLVGAVTSSMGAIGRETAHLVLAVLSRSNPTVLPAVRDLAAVPIFDWRQLRRWRIRERQLPAGSIINFKPPSLWEQHATFMLSVGGLFFLQSGLILALVLQSRRRRRAEREAQRRRQELAHMTRVATMGELTASLAHEINQPLAAILSNAQAGQRLLAAGGIDGDEIREILADIAADDQRAGEVIRRMRALLRKGESDPTTLDVNELVTEVAGLVRGEMILQNVALVLELYPDRIWVHGDRVQLQQVLLNLMMNGLDAMKDTSSGSRRLTVHTGPTNGRAVEVSVTDAGAGVPADKLDEIFEPFVTTKPHGMGLGLAICRSIIQAHGGRIGTANNADLGATFWFVLPAADKVKS